MAKTETAGLSRVVLYRREHAVLLLPRDRGMLAWTLLYGDEVRGGEEFFGDAGKEEPSARALTMMKKLVGERIEKWSPSLVEDPVEDRLHAIIKARRKSAKPARPKKSEPPRRDNVIDIMTALRKSLASEKKPSGKR